MLLGQRTPPDACQRARVLMLVARSEILHPLLERDPSEAPARADRASHPYFLASPQL